MKGERRKERGERREERGERREERGEINFGRLKWFITPDKGGISGGWI
jgi:hypothetical protein